MRGSRATTIMSVFHRILVAYDGSSDSQAALELAIALGRDQQAELTILTVIPDVATSVTNVAAGPLDVSDVYREIQESATAMIPDDLTASTILSNGSPAHRITEAAAEHDLVVMGTHGRGRIGEALAGSVSRAVVHSLRGAVLLTRAPEVAAEADPNDPA
jgi:nucleotide-binding universal stress UspA family protein